MAFPISIDTLKNTWIPSERRLNHSTEHNSIANILLALQTKIGVDNSLDTNSIDYYIKKSNKYSLTVGFSFANYICDGINDHVQIQQAIDYLASLGGGKLIIKEGTYNIGARINILYDNIFIVGEGAKTYLKLNNGVNDHVFKIGDGVTTYKYITVRDLQIDGNITNQVQQILPKGGVSIYLSKYCTIDNVIANNCLDFGIGIWQGDGCKNRIINCTTNGNGWDGIGITDSDENMIINNGAKGNGHAGIILNSSLFNTISGNTFNENSTGLVIKWSNRNSVVGNQCSWNLGGSGISVIGSDECTIVGNICHGNSYLGIRLDGLRRSTITGNTCNGNSVYPGEEGKWPGIGLFKSESVNNSTHNIITGNTCCDWKDVPTQKYGVTEGNINDDFNVFKNNYFFGNTTGGTSLKGVNSIESDNNEQSNVANFWSYKLDRLLVDGTGLVDPNPLLNINLKFSVKNWEGNDPTPWKPILYRDGDGVIRSITAPLSITIPAGTNHINAGRTEMATKEVDYFVFFQWNTTTTSTNVLLRRFPEATTMADIVNSGTNEKGAIGIVNYNATDTIVNIGRFSAILSAGGAYTWTLGTDVKHKPTYESRWLDFGTVFTGFSVVPTGIASVYKIIGDTCFYRPHANTNGTSNATTMTITAPFKAVDTGAAHWTGSFMAVDSGSFQANPGCLYFSTVNSFIEVYKNWAFGTWTNTGGKTVKDGMITYKI